MSGNFIGDFSQFLIPRWLVLSQPNIHVVATCGEPWICLKVHDINGMYNSSAIFIGWKASIEIQCPDVDDIPPAGFACQPQHLV